VAGGSAQHDSFELERILWRSAAQHSTVRLNLNASAGSAAVAGSPGPPVRGPGAARSQVTGVNAVAVASNLIGRNCKVACQVDTDRRMANFAYGAADTCADRKIYVAFNPNNVAFDRIRFVSRGDHVAFGVAATYDRAKNRNMPRKQAGPPCQPRGVPTQISGPNGFRG